MSTAGSGPSDAGGGEPRDPAAPDERRSADRRGDEDRRSDAGLTGETVTPPVLPVPPKGKERRSGTDRREGEQGERRRPRIRIVRWQGLIPLVLGLALLAAGYALFFDRVVESTTEEASTKFLGTQVDLEGVRIRIRETTLDLGRLQVADPLDRTKNLLDAGPVRVVLEPRPLLERKIVIRTMTIGDVRFNTRRATPAAPPPANSYAAQTIGALRQWTAQFKRPPLSFTPIDTIKQIVLDPTQLTTVREALALRARADSVKDAVEAGYRGLRLRETYDSAESVVRRLAGQSPLKLGVVGTRQAVADVRRTIAQIDSAKRRVEALKDGVQGGAGVLRDDLRSLDSARKADYAFARGLLALPDIEGPELGNAIFGDVSIQRFQQAMYWAEMAEHYMPPGLRPREDPGPKRLRAAGRTVRFPTDRDADPPFLLRAGQMRFTLGAGARANTYVFNLADLTSAPAVVKRPVRFALRQTAGETGLAQLRVTGYLDHTTATLRDSVGALARGLKLPGFALPGLPYRVEPGEAATTFDFVRAGGRIAARWSVRADQVAWLADSVATRAARTSPTSRGGRAADYALDLIGRVVSGLDSLDFVATLAGPIAKPDLHVRSNLDRALKQRLKEVAGEELAKAERMVRAKVDSVVEARTAPIRARAQFLRDSLETEARSRVEEARNRLDEERKKLEERLKALGASAIPLPQIPKVPRLPGQKGQGLRE
ncbi:MAG TPA: hypothetical protein VKA84_07825 [Gemmatimonadaceae bacterium]|nr:hypothetical protein [Gemmatimonadaceae bacterium]